MKSRMVATIASNEDDVRFRIFAGELPIDQAGHELLRMERAQHAAERERHRATHARYSNQLRQLTQN